MSSVKSPPVCTWPTDESPWRCVGFPLTMFHILNLLFTVGQEDHRPSTHSRTFKREEASY